MISPPVVFQPGNATVTTKVLETKHDTALTLPMAHLAKFLYPIPWDHTSWSMSQKVITSQGFETDSYFLVPWIMSYCNTDRHVDCHVGWIGEVVGFGVKSETWRFC